jgi:molybdopterin molybdotransferase
MTGAPIPVGADAVIPIELSEPSAFQPENEGAVVTFPGEVPVGTYVRERGSDVEAGELLLSAGALLGASQWGLLAASGVAEVPLVSRLRVLLVSTGDELVMAGRPLEAGEIYDANGASMAVALAAAGAVVSDILVVSDDAVRLRALVEERLDGADLVLTTGGASRGAYEVVREVFGPIGVEFVTVAMQPGGPQGLGAAQFAGRSIPVVAFPGNPVSALVSFEVFLRPILLSLHGLTGQRPSGHAPLAEPVDSPEAKHQILRGRMNQSGQIEVIGGTSSHLLHNYSDSTLLVHIPVGVAHLDAGELVEVWSIDD